MTFIETVREIIQFRELVRALVVRELKMRYRGSILGFLWSFLNPLLLMAVYAVIFSFVSRHAIQNYTIFVLTGLLPWLWFSIGLSHSVGSIVGGGALIKKIVFPVEILPLVSVMANLANFILSLPILFLFILASGMMLTPWVLLLPVLIAIQFILMAGLGLILASLNVYLKDIEQVLGNLLTLTFFLTPILYPVSMVPDRLRILLYLNPLAPLFEGYRNLLFDGAPPPWEWLGSVALFSFAVLAVGFATLNRLRDAFAEEV